MSKVRHRHPARLPSLALVLGAAALLSPVPPDAAGAGPLARPLAVNAGTVPEHADWRRFDLVPDLAATRLAVVRRDPPGAFLQDVVPKGALAVINGGYFQKDYRPTGWLLDADGEIGAKNVKSTKGGVLALAGARAFVGRLGELGFAPDFAVQNSPLLLEPGAVVGIHKDDGRRAARTAVCLAGKRLHLVVIAAGSGQGPTLMELAELLKAPAAKGGLGCDVALNLDGGPSTGVWLPDGTGVLPPVPIGYGIAVLPR